MKTIITTLLLTTSFSVFADINLYGPGGPHTALQDAAKAYEQKEGVKVNVHFGPQAKWNEQAKKDADILFGASEQSALAIVRDHQEKFDEHNIKPLYLRQSIMLVKKGNPKNIRSVDDLTRKDIGIIVNDGGGTSNTSGTGLWEDIAGRKGNINTVASIRNNILLYTPNSGSARKAFETSPAADVWITWIDWAISNPDVGEVVKIAPDYAIWRDMNITVKKNATQETQKFAQWLSSEEAAKIVGKYGWTREITQ